MRLPSPALAMLFAVATGLGAHAGVDDPRAAVEQARHKAGEARARQSQLRGELNDVAGRIEALKTRDGKRVPAELPGLLQRSQELSDQLTQAAAEVTRVQGAVDAAVGRLFESLERELGALRTSVETADRSQRRALLDKLRALRRERDQVRAWIPNSTVPALGSEPSDDPADLLEHADALRDAQDKAQAQLRALDRRIAELRQEHDLDRRMGEFLGEGNAFDEQDRRFVGGPIPAQENSAFAMPAAQGAGAPQPTTARSAATAPTRDLPPRMTGPMPATGASADELGALEQKRAQLDTQAKDFSARASALERRAAELK